MVAAANADAEAARLRNVVFAPCNANVNVEQLLQSASKVTELRSASLQFPDPWFKVREDGPWWRSQPPINTPN